MPDNAPQPVPASKPAPAVDDAAARKASRKAARVAAAETAAKADAALKPFLLLQDAFGHLSGVVLRLTPAQAAEAGAKVRPATDDDLALFGRTPPTVA